jgi:hypothetical protein
MVEQIAQDDDSNQHVLIDTPDDVKILMSRDEFNEMNEEHDQNLYLLQMMKKKML